MIILLHDGCQSTLEYYFSHFSSSQFLPWDQGNALKSIFQNRENCIVIIRYIPNLLIQHSSLISSELVYFMDDDLLDWNALKGQPLKYQWKIYRYALSRKRWLKKNKVKLWVSSSYLAEKYADWNPKLVKPSGLSVDSRQRLILFYHGSASHMEEIHWLVPVIKDALERNKQLHFEIIGTQKTRNLFKGMERVSVIHPMSWESYKSFLQSYPRAIGLAPLLGSPFNSARSYTKFFDITRCSAVGLYADHPAFRQAVQHKLDGMLLPMKHQSWVDAILYLAENPLLREQMLGQAKTRALQLSENVNAN